MSKTILGVELAGCLIAGPESVLAAVATICPPSQAARLT
jgi:hypothetical protein